MERHRLYPSRPSLALSLDASKRDPIGVYRFCQSMLKVSFSVSPHGYEGGEPLLGPRRPLRRSRPSMRQRRTTLSAARTTVGASDASPHALPPFAHILFEKMRGSDSVVALDPGAGKTITAIPNAHYCSCYMYNSSSYSDWRSR